MSLMESTRIDEDLIQSYYSENGSRGKVGDERNDIDESLNVSSIDANDDGALQKLKDSIEEKDGIIEDQKRHILELKALVNNLMTELLRSEVAQKNLEERRQLLLDWVVEKNRDLEVEKEKVERYKKEITKIQKLFDEEKNEMDRLQEVSAKKEKRVTFKEDDEVQTELYFNEL